MARLKFKKKSTPKTNQAKLTQTSFHYHKKALTQNLPECSARSKASLKTWEGEPASLETKR